ncbi:MAG: hypothetical protein HOV94_21560 [Saccharothrix sp.]|nr:hypothetical protein [Saccharothrix sp.]
MRAPRRGRISSASTATRVVPCSVCPSNHTRPVSAKLAITPTPPTDYDHFRRQLIRLITAVTTPR